MKGWIRLTLENEENKQFYLHVKDILNWKDNYVRYKEGEDIRLDVMVKQSAKEIADLIKDASKEDYKK